MEDVKSIFAGIEVEGGDDHYGKPTIFIPKNAKNRFDFLNLASQHGTDRLYFGAGNDRGIADDLVPFLSSITIDYECLLEIDDMKQLENLPQHFIDRTQVIFVVQGKEVNTTLVNVFKIVTKDYVLWHDLLSPEVSRLDDPLYQEDKEVI